MKQELNLEPPMSETKTKLLENSITLYTDTNAEDKDPEDLLLEDSVKLAEMAGLWKDHESNLRFLVKVINGKTVKHLDEKGVTMETVGLRHELTGAEKIISSLIKYTAVYDRQNDNAPKVDKDNK